MREKCPTWLQSTKSQRKMGGRWLQNPDVCYHHWKGRCHKGASCPHAHRDVDDLEEWAVLQTWQEMEEDENIGQVCYEDNTPGEMRGSATAQMMMPHEQSWTLCGQSTTRSGRIWRP